MDFDSASDDQVRARITELVHRQHELREAGPDQAGRDQLAAMDVEQDRLWDLLRQRDALRETGGDPGTAHERAAADVENYRQ